MCTWNVGTHRSSFWQDLLHIPSARPTYRDRLKLQLVFHALQCSGRHNAPYACLAFKVVGPLQVLGTLITEWDEGRAMCEAFLQTEETAQQAARQLAAIAAYYGFDGWLLNLENELDTSLKPNLLLFLRCAPHMPAEIWGLACEDVHKMTWRSHRVPMHLLGKGIQRSM